MRCAERPTKGPQDLSAPAATCRLPDLWGHPLVLRQDMTVRQARDALARSDQRCALVDGVSGPCGVVSDEHLSARPDHELVASNLEFEVVRVPFDAGERATVRIYEQAAWASLLRRRPGHRQSTDENREQR